MNLQGENGWRRWSEGLHQAIEAKEILVSNKKIKHMQPLHFKITLGCSRKYVV